MSDLLADPRVKAAWTGVVAAYREYESAIAAAMADRHQHLRHRDPAAWANLDGYFQAGYEKGWSEARGD